ncbi:LysR family transcriptional regulator [Niveibacterium sp. SC-1]|uniref:LysR family transcriptional regulator n=1 Tax=Niveibacterium sp. SC-1 TaxID=3135646 RepID=UPI00311DE01C
MSTNLDRLALMQTFVRVVEAGSFSAAAKQMNATQPTVSRRMQSLERSLGMTLMQRSTHGMVLTEAGQRYYARAKELLASWSAFESDLRGAVDEPQGLLRVVVPNAFGQHHLITPLAAYLRAYPEVSVEWLLHDALPSFATQGVDCAVRVGEASDPSVVAIRIGEVPRIVVATPELLGRGRRPKQPDGLTRFPWLALGTYYRNELTLQHRQGATHTLALQPRLVTDSLYALRSATLQGLGLAALSHWVVEEDLAAGRLEQLVPEWQASVLPVYLVYPYAAFYPAKLRRFIEIMRGALGNLPVGVKGRRA